MDRMVWLGCHIGPTVYISDVFRSSNAAAGPHKTFSHAKYTGQRYIDYRDRHEYDHDQIAAEAQSLTGITDESSTVQSITSLL